MDYLYLIIDYSTYKKTSAREDTYTFIGLFKVYRSIIRQCIDRLIAKGGAATPEQRVSI